MKAISTFEEFQARKHFMLLDGIRAIAILAVLWHHSRGQTLFQWDLVERGYLGVDLFFVLSGFLITHLLIKEKRTKGSISLSKFYVRRTLRIFPLYYGYLLVLLVWTAVTHSPKLSMMLSSLPYYLLYISNWMPAEKYHFFHRAWSLAVEEQFYLLWPALVLSVGFYRPALMIIGILAASLFCAAGFLGDGAYAVNQLLVPYRTILLGCLVAIALNTKTVYERLVTLCSSSWSAPCLLIGTIGTVALNSGPLVGVAQLAVHFFMAAFLTACILNENNYLKPFLTLGWVRLIGVISYGIYILHGQFWGIAGRVVSALPGTWADSRTLFFLCLTLFSVFVAYVSFNTYEKFFLKLKTRYEVK